MFSVCRNSLLLLWTFFWSAWGVLHLEAAFSTWERSISHSKQFIVYCPDAILRNEACSRAEEIKKDILKLLQENDKWESPIIINIEKASSAEPERPVSEVRIFELDKGYKIDVSILVGDNPEDTHFQRQIVRAVLLELVYRGHGKIVAGKTYSEPPDWLIEGIEGNLNLQMDDSAADICRVLMENDRLPHFESFLNQPVMGMDSTSRRIYKACAVSLVRLLADLPEGGKGLAGYLKKFSGYDRRDLSVLLDCFPSMGKSRDSLEKWWAVGMAKLSIKNRYQGWDAIKTEETLKKLLVIIVPEKEEMREFTLGEYKEFLRLEKSRPILENLTNELRALGTRAFPLYRPVVMGYQEAVALLAKRKTRGMQERLVRLAEEHAAISGQIGMIADYMNWFEATQISTPSRSFDNYLKLFRELNRDKAERRDAVSHYINAIELEFKKL